jgi:hypothetical protein
MEDGKTYVFDMLRKYYKSLNLPPCTNVDKRSAIGSTDIHFGSQKQINPLSKNIFQNFKKFRTKISHTHLDILYSYTNFPKKEHFLCPV